MNKILHVINLHCIRQQRLLFSPISFDLHAGEVLLIEGANGSGKSSLLRLLAGLSSAPKGEIHWHAQNIQTLRDQYYKNVHYLGHTNGIKLGLSVNENLRLARDLSATNKSAFGEVLEQWQLHAFKDTLASQLSAGQKRRIALAKLSLLQKPLWILDEPLTALDEQVQKIFLSALEIHLSQGGIAVISSHHPLYINAKIKNQRLEPC